MFEGNGCVLASACECFDDSCFCFSASFSCRVLPGLLVGKIGGGGGGGGVWYFGTFVVITETGLTGVMEICGLFVSFFTLSFSFGACFAIIGLSLEASCKQLHNQLFFIPIIQITKNA